jgi:hypothetical protein
MLRPQPEQVTHGTFGGPNGVSEIETYITTLPQLEAAIRRLAAKIDVPACLLPTFDHIIGDATPYVEQKSDGFHWVISERGREYKRVVTRDAKEILWLVFSIATGTMASHYEAAHRVSGADSRRLSFARQSELLDQLDSTWARRCEREHEEILARYPYSDG